jgi:hypothetical protein
MQLHFMLAMLVLLLATHVDITSASKCGVKTATPPAAIDNNPTTPHEERNKGAAGAAARTAGGAIPANPPTGQNPGMVTNTIYSGNGVWQRMHKWWTRTFINGTRRLRRRPAATKYIKFRLY